MDKKTTTSVVDAALGQATRHGVAVTDPSALPDGFDHHVTDGRLHPLYKRDALTGMIRSAKPSWENLFDRNATQRHVSGSDAATVLVADEGEVFIDCSVVRSHVHALAKLSGDRALAAALAEPDPFQALASRWGCSRHVAKVILLSLPYGLTAGTVTYLRVTHHEFGPAVEAAVASAQSDFAVAQAWRADSDVKPSAKRRDVSVVRCHGLLSSVFDEIIAKVLATDPSVKLAAVRHDTITFRSPVADTAAAAMVAEVAGQVVARRFDGTVPPVDVTTSTSFTG